MLELDTERLTLRQLVPDDSQNLVGLANNINIARMVAAVPHPYTLDDALKFIESVAKANSSGKSISLGIFLNSDKSLIGTAGVKEGEEPGVCELGYWIGEPFWGAGFATEAVQALTQHFFLEADGKKLIAKHAIDNPASKRVLEKTGMRYTGKEDMHHSIGRGRDVACRLFELDVQGFQDQFKVTQS